MMVKHIAIEREVLVSTSGPVKSDSVTNDSPPLRRFVRAVLLRR